jgi:XTP/dITP diphosphohydrolase
MEKLLLITGNKEKATEFSRLLGVSIIHQKITLPEIQNTSVSTVAKIKAEEAYSLVNRPVFVDDTGLYINAWNNLPGAFIAWFLNNVGNEGILRMLESWDDRSAKVITALGYCDQNGSQVFIGEITGKIANSVKGKNGFGYDPIFIPDGQSKTFAEMNAKEKDSHSMRAIAAKLMGTYLTDNIYPTNFNLNN